MTHPVDRGRLDELIDALAGEAGWGDADAARVGQTRAASSYPTAAGSWYDMDDLVVSGTEAEGASASFNSTGDGFRAINLGPNVPPAGTRVLCLAVGGRYVFRY